MDVYRYTARFHGSGAVIMSDNTCSRCGQHIPLFLHNQKELDALIAEEWALGHEQSACEKCADAPCSAQSHTEEARAARVIAARIRGSAIKEPILVWPFADAPKEFQACATGCNTADWLALVPAHMQRVDVAWLRGGTAFARFLVEEIRLLDGRRVYIGCRV